MPQQGSDISFQDVPSITVVHEIALGYPAMDHATHEALRIDVERYGQREPIIVMPNGKILDGHHRWRICQENGIEPWVGVCIGSDPAAYAFSKNAQRRSLTQSQRAMLAVNIRNFANSKLTQQARAARVGVSKRYVEMADKLAISGRNRELIARVKSGDRPLADAYNEVMESERRAEAKARSAATRSTAQRQPTTRALVPVPDVANDTDAPRNPAAASTPIEQRQSPAVATEPDKRSQPSTDVQPAAVTEERIWDWDEWVQLSFLCPDDETAVEMRDLIVQVRRRVGEREHAAKKRTQP